MERLDQPARRREDIRSRPSSSAKERPKIDALAVRFAGARRIALVGIVLACAIAAPAWWLWHPEAATPDVVRNDSYWATPLPEDAPVDPRSDAFIDWLERDNEPDHILLAGTTSSGRWGLPIFRSGEGDPTYSVENSCPFHQPREFRSVRIPRGAAPDDTADAEMVVYDLDKRLAYGFFRASYSEDKDRWSACGGAVYYLDSNGLDGELTEGDESRNFGHRGLPPYVYAVQHDEIQQGSIGHVLKIAVNTASERHVFPMTGSDGNSTAALALPEGARIRLKPDIDVSALELTDAERVIATALQEYGAVIGDQTGGGIVLKVENTVAEGQGNVWEGTLSEHSLADIGLDDFEVIELGYRPD